MKLKKSQKQQTVRFLHRSVLFLSFLLIVLFIFFVFGNFQYFIDSTQEKLLQFLSITAISLMILAFITFCIEIGLFIKMKARLYFFLSFISFLTFLLGVAGSFFSGSILILSRGIL
ncbi:MAG TPA: hypothetical protein VJ861_01720 [Treponemataceae bacterium]|nr:hypothetical protein [Treponemataceae bacterium]